MNANTKSQDKNQHTVSLLEPDDLIREIMKIDDSLNAMCLNGDCYRLSCFLTRIYDNAEQWISGARDHVVTKINGVFYDADGRVSDKRIIRDGYKIMETSDHKAASKWKYRKYAR